MAQHCLLHTPPKNTEFLCFYISAPEAGVEYGVLYPVCFSPQRREGRKGLTILRTFLLFNIAAVETFYP
jgi:hypothetical protein